MLYVVTGGSGSGKSAYAESVVKQLNTNPLECYYIATMNPSEDAETKARIKRHRDMRKDSGMVTIECPVNIASINAKSGSIFLLECMSNLLANEMFFPEGSVGYTNSFNELCKQVDTTIITPVAEWIKQDIEVVIVTNEVFSDGNTYEIETEKYVELLGYINRELGKMADKVVEVVCGIPVVMKE